MTGNVVLLDFEYSEILDQMSILGEASHNRRRKQLYDKDKILWRGRQTSYNHV